MLSVSLTQKYQIPRILRRFGNRRAGEIAAVILGFGIIAWGNCFRFFKNRSFGFTPFLVTYTLIQLVSHNTVRVARNPNLKTLELLGHALPVSPLDFLLIKGRLGLGSGRASRGSRSKPASSRRGST